jgi:hypothetical protein
MTAGQSLTIETVRVAAALYVLSVAAWLERRDRAARIAWTFACASYLVHVVAAFEFYHHWSHTAAYFETARQTANTVGIDWGGGLYFNYLFTLIWIVDALWWWRVGLVDYRERRWIGAAIHCFLAFMFFNATVVFASGIIRWLGVTATFALLLIAHRYRKRAA